MESYLNNQELAILLAEFNSSGTAPERTANKLIKNFLPAISHFASRYPAFWKDDLVQEGKIALLQAARKFPGGSVSEFFSYAYAAIKNRIISFYNAFVKRQPQTVELILASEDDDHPQYQVEYSDDYDIVANREKAYDLKTQLSDETLTHSGLSQKEIQVFNLYFIKDRTLTEIAEELEISGSQASRLKISAREKVKQILK
ncbi:MAG: hypothetical protein JWQ66_2128 [Mucilaginibacter sp.]|nr:hypothetical protein [Mucilaginibacter sp.]